MKNTATPPWHRAPKFSLHSKASVDEPLPTDLPKEIKERPIAEILRAEPTGDVPDEVTVVATRAKQSELSREENSGWKLELDRMMLAESRPLTVAGYKQKKKEITELRLHVLNSLQETITKKEKTKITTRLCELRNLITMLRVAASMIKSIERKTKKLEEKTCR